MNGVLGFYYLNNYLISKNLALLVETKQWLLNFFKLYRWRPFVLTKQIVIENLEVRELVYFKQSGELHWEQFCSLNAVNF